MAAVMLVVLAPLYALISLMVLLRMGRPVLYRGTRVGRDRQEFSQLKFRSMVRNADSLLSEDGIATTTRVTPLGSALRKTSLDELPQLVNIVRGEMVFVGPRPLLPEVAERVPTHSRYDVLPGLTGLAQISGRNMLPWSKRLLLDAEYVASRSPSTDLKIVVRTIIQVVRGRDIAPDRNPQQVMDL